MNRTTTNGILAVGALTIPLIAEYANAKPGNVPGTGFDVLLYKPFDFAFSYTGSEYNYSDPNSTYLSK